MVGFVTIFVYALGAYIAVGGATMLWLHLCGGLRKIDPSTDGTSILFRITISPGLVGLWPVMLAKYVSAGKEARGGGTFGAADRPIRPRTQRSLHGLAMLVLAVALPVLIAASLKSRQQEAAPYHRERLSVGALPIAETTNLSEPSQLFEGNAPELMGILLQRPDGTHAIELSHLSPETQRGAAPLMIYADPNATKTGEAGGKAAANSASPSSPQMLALGLFAPGDGAAAFPLPQVQPGSGASLTPRTIRLYLYDSSTNRFATIGVLETDATQAGEPESNELGARE